ncbi:MAG TPA: glycosyltransferase [Panacibacter sp.]|nr:glycosyltransferase [Panacibacter sp.]
MNTILVTAYAINPFNGSEDGTGWNFVMQIARHNNVIAVTRKNNRPHIERYQTENPEMQARFDRITFMYFDWPKKLIWWKKGPLLSLIYFYMWQFTLAVWLKSKKLSFDIAHNLNFHNDWTPTFLWILGKPLVWGPVGHHPKIPKQFVIDQYGKKEYLKDRYLWLLKNIFWKLDPFVFISRKKADHVVCINSEAPKKLKLARDKYSIIPAVASEMINTAAVEKPIFRVISSGRFVALKGFDVTIRSFAAFYNKLSAEQKTKTELVLVGTGEQKQLLEGMIAAEGIKHCTKIINWIPRTEMMDLFSSSSVFLFPSHEGAGMVVPEAMSYGLPVLCWDNCGPGEFIHPSSKLAVPYRSYKEGINSYAENLYRLFSDKLFYKEESLLATERYHNLFNWDIKGDQLNSIYSKVLTAKNKKAAQVGSDKPLTKQRIVAVHLLNDRSGSPLVFRQALITLSKNNRVDLYTATPSGDGFLSNIPGINQHNIFYKWHSNKFILLALFLFAQTYLFVKILFNISRKDTLYINTLLPFGAALAAKLRGCKVVYHIHEVSVKPQGLKNFLTTVAEKTALEIIFVSNFVKEQFNFIKPVIKVVYNTLPENFIEETKLVANNNKLWPFTVLMLCSLKKYKGIYEFVDLSKKLPHINFILVLNAAEKDMETFRQSVNAPANCFMFSAKSDTVPFYKLCHLVVNLSNPDEWIETFGMTVLEAMQCGRPVIVPPAGGVTELVHEGQDGFYVNSSNMEELSRKVELLASSPDMYKKMADTASKNAANFSPLRFNGSIDMIFQKIA